MKDKITVHYEVVPLDMDGVIACTTVGLELLLSMLDLIPFTPLAQDAQRLNKVYALAYGVQQQLEELERQAQATLAAEMAANTEGAAR